MIPEALIYDTNVSALAVRVYGALLRHRNEKTGRCDPSRKRLAGELGVKSTSTIDAALMDLLDAGWLAKFERYRPDGSQTSNGFAFPRDPPPASREGGTSEPGRGVPANREPRDESVENESSSLLKQSRARPLPRRAAHEVPSSSDEGPDPVALDQFRRMASR
jgi:hypothetical protein